MNSISKALLGAAVATVAILSGVDTAKAAVIASTDFDGRIVSGATASNLSWIINGVADPGDLTANFSLFDTPAAQNRFAVDRNLRNAGPWSVDIPIVVGGSGIELSQVTLDALEFENAGTIQPNSLDLDLNLALLDSTFTSLDSVSILNIFPVRLGTPAGSKNVVFDLSGNTLSANSTNYLRLTASTSGTFGVNAGIDNLVVNGTVLPTSTEAVPEPLMILGSLAALGLGGMMKRKFVA